MAARRAVADDGCTRAGGRCCFSACSSAEPRARDLGLNVGARRYPLPQRPSVPDRTNPALDPDDCPGLGFDTNNEAAPRCGPTCRIDTANPLSPLKCQRSVSATRRTRHPQFGTMLATTPDRHGTRGSRLSVWQTMTALIQWSRFSGTTGTAAQYQVLKRFGMRTRSGTQSARLQATVALAIGAKLACRARARWPTD